MVLNFFKTIFLASILLGIISCNKSKDDNNLLGGSQSDIGAANNSFTITNISGVSNVSAKVTELSDGVSNVSYTGTVTNSTYLDLLKSTTDVNVAGTSVSCNCKCRITSEGMESVFEEGTLTLVKYDAKVGDSWSLKRGSSTLKREVTAVSKEDNYYWNGMYVKTMTVKETGRNVPGFAGTEFVFNHRYGIVGVKIFFEDGTSKEVGVSSKNTN